MNNHCEECLPLDDMELPPPARTITNHKIEGVLEIEQAFADSHDLVSHLPIMVDEPEARHGEWRIFDRYCVPCNEWRPGLSMPNGCHSCGAGWEIPTSKSR